MAEYVKRAAIDFPFLNSGRIIDGELFVCLDEIYAEVKKLPAADVVPVVHGRWEFDGSDFADIWKCTACGDEWFFEYDPRDNETRVNHCPNCGAKMDQEVRHE